MVETEKLKRVLLINWDSYPNFPTGGVYTWAKNLIDNLSDWEIYIVNQLSNSNVNSVYKVPRQVKQIIEVPIFGSTRLEEYCDIGGPFVSKITRTNDRIIKDEFLPLFNNFLKNIIADKCDTGQIKNSISNLRNFLVNHDSKKCVEHAGTWEVFRDIISSDGIYGRMELSEAVTTFRVLQRGLQVLSVPVPKVDLIHCSVAWVPSLIAVSEKMERKIPVIITEHGVAFRELLLYYNGYLYNEPSKVLWKVLSRNVVRTIYSVADLILPVCRANAEWEKKLGTPQEKIRVVYNGVDTKRFRPLPVKRDNTRPTVVSVGRVDVFKDVIGLMQAIKYASQDMPNIHCDLHGGSTDLDYAVRCMRAFKALEIQNNFTFKGRTSQPELAYNSGDLVLFTAITEGFPFAVIEAMACGKAIIASDVGGVKEALEGCGVLVRSRRPKEVAKEVVALLKDERRRNELGMAALQRARDRFTLEQSVREYREIYENVTSPRYQKPTEVIFAH